MSRIGPRPSYFDNTVVMGAGSPADDTPPRARLGGLWLQPDYALSYLLAARYVIEKADETNRVDETCLPAAFLQRHAFELALKAVAGLASQIKADAAWLDALKQDPSAARPAEQPPKFSHEFSALIDELDNALTNIGFEAVPDDIRTQAKRLTDVEELEHTRLRYPEIKPKGAPLQGSFPDPVVLAVGETQLQLESLFETFFVYETPTDGEDNLMTELCCEAGVLDQAIMKIVPLV